MAAFFDSLDKKLIDFIHRQKIFFTATAPAEGRINLSPKGMDTFRCLDEKTVGYLDLTGSGNETAGHLNENGRMTFMFCSFDKQPRILRLYGTGRVVRPDESEWTSLITAFELMPGVRQLILMDIESVQTSCGYAVPEYQLVRERPTLIAYSEKKGPDGLEAYRQEKNLRTIDGKPVYPTYPQ